MERKGWRLKDKKGKALRGDWQTRHTPNAQMHWQHPWMNAGDCCMPLLKEQSHVWLLTQLYMWMSPSNTSALRMLHPWLLTWSLLYIYLPIYLTSYGLWKNSISK
jgi:hypothetical protein